MSLITSSNFRKQVSSFKQRMDLSPSYRLTRKNTNPDQILNLLDRKIRDMEKKENRKRLRKNLTRDPTKRTAHVSRRMSMSPAKGILRKAPSSIDSMKGGVPVGDSRRTDRFSINSQDPSKRCTSMSHMEGGLGFHDYSRPGIFQKAMTKVRFQTGDKAKSNVSVMKTKRKGKSVCQRECWSDPTQTMTSSIHNDPSYNKSSNRKSANEWHDLRLKWGDSPSKNDSLRTSRFGSPGGMKASSGDSRSHYKFNSDMSQESANQQNYHNENFDKLDKLINSPLDNIDVLMSKYGNKSSYKDSGSCRSSFDNGNNATSKYFDIGMMQNMNEIHFPEKNIYLSGSFTRKNNVSKNNPARQYSDVHVSPIRTSPTRAKSATVAFFKSPSKSQSPIKNFDKKDSPISPNEKINNENLTKPSSPKKSDKNGLLSEPSGYLASGSPTVQRSRVGSDVTEDTTCCKTDTEFSFSDRSPERQQVQSKDQSFEDKSDGCCSPLVFDSPSYTMGTVIGDITEKYMPGSGTWMPQSKVLAEIFENEYSGPFSRLSFERKGDFGMGSTSRFSKTEEKLGMTDNVQNLINMVNGNLADATCSDVHRVEQEKQLDLQELNEKLSLLVADDIE